MILVVGGTGTIGSEVVRLLHEAKQPFRVLARKPAVATDLQAKGIAAVVGDLRDPATLPAALQGVDKVFLLAPYVPDMVQMRGALIAAAKAAGVRHVVMSTGVGAAPDAGAQVGRWHGENQKQLQDSGMAWTFLQPTFFMDNLLGFADSVRAKGEFYMPIGDGKVSWIDARDIAVVGFKALVEPGHESKAYVLTGPQALGGADLAAVLTRVAGRKVVFVPITLEQAKQAMIGFGMPAPMADAMNELYAFVPPGYLEATTDTVQSVGGRAARAFEQFATDHAAAFKGD